MIMRKDLISYKESSGNGLKRILLIRHGESQHNADRVCFSGISDVCLTDAGRMQAVGLQPVLASLAIDSVCSSPIKRAMETAVLAAPSFRRKIQIVQGLAEFDYGDYDGVSLADICEDDSFFNAWQNSPGDLSFPNGGNIANYAEKAYNDMKNIALNSSGKVIACFSHKTTIRLIIAKTLGLPLDYFRRIPCCNLSISEFRYDSRAFWVENINQLFK